MIKIDTTLNKKSVTKKSGKTHIYSVNEPFTSIIFAQKKN